MSESSQRDVHLCKYSDEDVSMTTDLDYTSGIMTIIEDSIRTQLPLVPSLDTVAMTTESDDAECQIENIPILNLMDNISTKDIPFPLELLPAENVSINIMSDDSAAPITTLPDTVSMVTMPSDISFQTMRANEIDMESPLLPERPISLKSLNTSENMTLLSVCPVINVLPVDESTSNDINIEDIELYLECSDDSENIVENVLVSNNMVQAGTSFIRSDMRLKISFPVFPEERDKGFKCSVCKSYFLTEQMLRDHIFNEHKTIVNICRFCSYNTKSMKFFETHMKTKHKDIFNQTAFGTTLEQTMTKDYLRNEIIDMSVVSILESESTDKIHLNNTVYDTNSLINCDTMLQTLTDNQDKSRYANEDLLHSTEDKHIREKKRISKTVTTQETLLFVCEVCEFVTKSAKLLYCHQQTMHSEEKKSFRCSECKFTCKQKRSFDSHVKMHNGMYNFTCEICRKSFVTKSIYTRHLKTHNTSRNYICDHNFCGKEFRTRGQVTDHKKKVHAVHKNEMANENMDSLRSNSQCKSSQTCDKSVNVNFSSHSLKDLNRDHKFKKCQKIHLSNASLTSEIDDSISDHAERYRRNRNLVQEASLDMDSIDIPRDDEVVNKKSQWEQSIKAGTVRESDITKENSVNNIKDIKCNIMKNKNKLSSSKCEKKGFPCTYRGCDRTFRDNYNLHKHICTHTKVKQVACNLCSYTCVQKSSLNHHIKSRHCSEIKKS